LSAISSTRSAIEVFDISWISAPGRILPYGEVRQRARGSALYRIRS